MGNFTIVEGDLIKLAKEGKFDVITHGCNCFCRMGNGIAPLMDDAFGCNNSEMFKLEGLNHRGSILKLGDIDAVTLILDTSDSPSKGTIWAPWYKKLVREHKGLTVVNSYTQFHYGSDKINLSYSALRLCMRKINHQFPGKSIGLPKIGCGLAGGDWDIVKDIIIKELKDMDITICVL